MRRIHATGILIALGAILVLAAGWQAEKKISAAQRSDVMPQDVQGSGELSVSHEVPTSEEASVSQKNMEQFGRLSDEILDSCSKEFIGNYAIDESFLGWIDQSYGRETLTALAREAQQEQPDVELWYELTGESIHVLWLDYCDYIAVKPDASDHVYRKECASEDEIVLDFTGDINFSEGWGTTVHMDAQPNGIYDCFSADLLQEMNAADIMMINNEFPYSTRGKALEGKAFTFRADPSRVQLLEVFGTDVVGVANNHMYDYGPDALVDSVETLAAAGVPYTGAGHNIREAQQPVFFVANGRKIAIIAATQIERSYNYTREATETEPGVLKTLNAARYVAAIEQAKKSSDYVIAFVHWGTEGDNQYGTDQVKLAKRFVEAGADVIIGGHTHCLQGIQYMDGVPIIYSLGNFWFSEETLDTGLAQVRIQRDGSIRFRFIPCIQENYRTTMVSDETEKQRILDFMSSISKKVSYDADGYVTDLSGT